MRRAEVLLPFRQSPFVTEILGVVPDPGGKIERGRFCQVGICFADHRQTFASLWGEGTTFSSDGQRFQAGGRGEEAGQVNPSLRDGNLACCSTRTHPTSTQPFHLSLKKSRPERRG
jgi:hypothetical protein